MVIDSFKTIQGQNFEEIKEKSSKFLAFAYRVNSVAEVEKFLYELKLLHPKATHHCYAYQIGVEGDTFRANDDGEPSGTAGKPILGQIKSFGLTNVLVVVVRYYGGTKLGASGLINAYKEAAAMVLGQCQTVEDYIFDYYKISFPYEKMGQLMNDLKSCHFEILVSNFEISPYLYVEIRKSISTEMIRKLKAKLLNFSLDRIQEDTNVEGITFKKTTYPIND